MCTLILPQLEKGVMSHRVLQVVKKKKSSMKRFESHSKVTLKEASTQSLLMGIVQIKEHLLMDA